METKKEEKKVPKKNYKKPKDSVIIPIKKEMDRNEIVEKKQIRAKKLNITLICNFL